MAKPNMLNISEAAAYLGLSRQYLYSLKSQKLGPAFTMLEVHGLGRGPTRRVFYKKSDLDHWNANGRKRRGKAKTATKKAA